MDMLTMLILECIVMPHNFYLHSSLVLSRKMQRTEHALKQAFFYNLIDCAVSLNLALFVNCSILIGSLQSIFWLSSVAYAP
jgi:manganese transport protein